MFEELYIIKDGRRCQLDLNSPSGITLNFKSNLFGDLTKITASYSYTFKLPMSRRNREVLDMAEDIRCDASPMRERLYGEFIQNGICLFPKCNLYLDTTAKDYYNVVMTWGVVDGFAELKDNDISLRELGTGQEEIVRYEGGHNQVTRPTDWHNDDDVTYPYRGESLYCQSNGEYGTMTNSGNEIIKTSAMPVVPILSLIGNINNHYGTKFSLGYPFGGAACWDATLRKFKTTKDHELINRGCVPFVNNELTDEQLERRTAILTNFQVKTFKLHNLPAPVSVFDGFALSDVLTFNLQTPEVNNYFEIGGGGNLPSYNFCFWKKNNLTYIEKLYADGYFKASFRDIYFQWNSDGTLKEKKNEGQIPKFIIYRVTLVFEDNKNVGKLKFEEAASIEGKYIGPAQLIDGGYTYDFPVFEFDFSKENGMERIEIKEFNMTSAAYPCFMAFTFGIRTLECAPLKLIPQGQISDNVTNGFEMDKFSNLPDVSCLTFMKSLFFMMGAFPVPKDGRVVPMFYTDLQKNICNSKVLDWSNKLCSSDKDQAETINYKVSGFAQKNWYLMKNSEIEKTEKEKEEETDIYEEGMMSVNVDNSILDKERTVIQLPWHGPYLIDRSKPSYNPCRDIKMWKFSSNGSKERCESQPAIGMMYAPKVANWEPTTGAYSDQGSNVLYMEIYNPFKSIEENPDYAYLEKIVRHPKTVTEYLRLNEFDLRDLDYSEPVYLNKYNAYFAIVSITRDSKGKCKCELIKLP